MIHDHSRALMGRQFGAVTADHGNCGDDSGATAITTIAAMMGLWAMVTTTGYD